MRRRRDSREKGSVLLVCIGILVVMAVMAAGFITAITAAQKASTDVTPAELAKLAAESGMARTIKMLVYQESNASNTFPTHYYGALDSSYMPNQTSYALDYIMRPPSSSKVTLASIEDIIPAPFLFQYYKDGHNPVTAVNESGYLGSYVNSSGTSQLTYDEFYDSFGVELRLFRDTAATVPASYGYYTTIDELNNKWVSTSGGRYQVRYAVFLMDLSGSMCGVEPPTASVSGVDQYVYNNSTSLWSNVASGFDSSSSSLQRDSAYTSTGVFPSFRQYMLQALLPMNDVDDIKYSMLATPYQRDCRVNILTAPPAVLRAMLFSLVPSMVNSSKSLSDSLFGSNHNSVVYPSSSASDPGTYNLGESDENGTPSYVEAISGNTYNVALLDDGSTTVSRDLLKGNAQTVQTTTVSASGSSWANTYYHDLIMAVLQTAATWRAYDKDLSGLTTDDFVAAVELNLATTPSTNTFLDNYGSTNSLTAAEVNKLKAKAKLMEVIRNDFFWSLFGNYAKDYTAADTVNTVSASADYSTGLFTSTATTLSGRFYVGKSQYFRVMVRGEVYDSTNSRVIAESNLESVYYIHYDDPTGLTSLGYDSAKNHKLYQRWVFNRETDGKF